MTTDDYFGWTTDMVGYSDIVRDTIRITKFMAKGCRQKVVDRQVEVVKKSFTKFKQIMQLIRRKRCFGNQNRVLSIIFDFDEY